jgi:hypothetical protein
MKLRGTPIPATVLLGLVLAVPVLVVGQDNSTPPLAVPAACPSVPGFTFQPLQRGLGTVLASGLASFNDSATLNAAALAAACNLDVSNKVNQPPYVARCNAFTTTGVLLAVSIRPRYEAMPGGGMHARALHMPCKVCMASCFRCLPRLSFSPPCLPHLQRTKTLTGAQACLLTPIHTCTPMPSQQPRLAATASTCASSTPHARASVSINRSCLRTWRRWGAARTTVPQPSRARPSPSASALSAQPPTAPTHSAAS